MKARGSCLVAVVCLIVVGAAAVPTQANGSFGFSHYGGPYVVYDPYRGTIPTRGRADGRNHASCLLSYSRLGRLNGRQHFAVVLSP